jgi:hypothetical protein
MRALYRSGAVIFTILLVAIVAISGQKTWNGSMSSDWGTAGNWSPSGVPSASDTVTILQYALSNPNVNIDASCAALVVEYSRTLNFNTDGKTLTVLGVFGINGGATVSFGAAATLTIGGTLNNGNLFMAGTGTVIINGGAIAGSSPTTFSNLTINNGADVYVSIPVTVTGALTFTNGRIVLVGSDLTIASGGTISGASSSRYIVTDGSGRLIRSGVGTSAVSFPVGIASSYDPVTLQSGTGTDDFSVGFIDQVSPPGANDAAALQRTWDISEATPGGNGAITVTLQWNGSEEGGSFSPRTSAVCWRYTGTSWVQDGTVTGITGTDPYTATITGLSNLGHITMAQPGALPIQMASFAANVVRNNDVEVAWKTVSETNNYGFEIYRKRGDAGDWINIGFVEGHGTTLAAQSYSYLDRALPFGTYHYQIKQVDLDGKSETFPLMTVNVGVAPERLTLGQNYPNPFNPSTVIEFVVPMSGHATMKVYNVLGQEVARLFDGNAEAGRINSTRFDASNLPSGLYFYTLKSAGASETKRMLLMK